MLHPAGGIMPEFDSRDITEGRPAASAANRSLDVISERYPDDMAVTFHVNREVSKFYDVRVPRGVELTRTLKRQLGDVGTTLVHRLYTIPGIKELRFGSYDLSLIKGLAYDTSALEISVLGILGEVFDVTASDVRYRVITPPALPRSAWPQFDDYDLDILA
jgi:hypothetical protein